MDVGSALSIGFCTADDLASNGCNFSGTEEQEAKQVGCRVAFGPLEVDMWQTIRSDPARVNSRAASAFGTVELLNVRTRYRSC